MNTDDNSHTALMSSAGRTYSAFCRGRLGHDPSPDYGLHETVAHALGVDSVGVGQGLPSLIEVAAAVAQLLAEPPTAAAPKPSPAKPAAQAERPASHRSLSPRVVAILRELGFDPEQFHRKGPRTPEILRALTARRLVVLSLHAQGLTADEIAHEAGIDPWTARSHVRAARQRPST